MFRFYLISAFVLVFSFVSAFSQETKLQGSSDDEKSKISILGVPKDVIDICSKFFERLIAEQVDLAFDELINNSPIKKKAEELKKLKEEVKRANLLYGTIKSYEPVSSDIVSESFLRVRYLAYHTEFPMRWIFTFYKSPKYGWIVVNIRFDDLSDTLFPVD